MDYFRSDTGPAVCTIYWLAGVPERFPVTLHHVPVPGGSPPSAMSRCGRRPGDRASREALSDRARSAYGIDRIREQVRPSRQVYDTVRMAQHAAECSKQVCYRRPVPEWYTAMLGPRGGFRCRDPAAGQLRRPCPPPLRPIADNRSVATALLRTERRLRRSEDRVATTFGTSLLISEAEAVELAARTGVSRDRGRSLPRWCACARRCERGASREPEAGRPVFVFLGLLSCRTTTTG